MRRRRTAMGRVAAAEEAEGKRVAGVVEDGPALGGKVASALRKMRDMGGRCRGVRICVGRLKE